jgi:hypothetical protein
MDHYFVDEGKGDSSGMLRFLFDSAHQGKLFSRPYGAFLVYGLTYLNYPGKSQRKARVGEVTHIKPPSGDMRPSQRQVSIVRVVCEMPKRLKFVLGSDVVVQSGL